MNSFNIENQGTHTYLTYQFKDKENIDTMSLGMLSNNKVAGVAPIVYVQIDGDSFAKYDITSKVTAREFLEGHVNKKRLIGLFSSIITAIISSEEYMIDVNTLIFDLDYIYVDATTCKAEMVCLPVLGNDNSEFDLGLFFKNIMFSVQFDPTESSEYITRIMNYLNGAKNLNVADFKVKLDELKNQQSEAPAYQRQTATANTGKTDNASRSSQVYGGYSGGSAEQTVAKPKKSKAAKVPTAKAEKAAPEMNIPGTNIQVLGSNMQIPNAPVQNSVQSTDDEDKISLMYLLQHYNKENAEKYKAQKENKNSGKASKSAKAEKPAKASKEKPAKKKKGAASGFSVPGQDAGFAVPGQNPKITAPGNNGGFAIPGQNSNFVKPEKEQKIEVPGQKPASVVSGNMAAGEQPRPTFIPPTMGREDADFGDTVVMADDMDFSDEATVVIDENANMPAVPFLIRKINNEKTMIDKPLVKIGRDKNHVDYCIDDNKAIGRNHANILNRGGEYFIVDINSTNHTYVDDRMIPSGAETKLSHGTKIRLANEDFEFRMF